METIQGRQVAFARHTEHMGHALGHKAFNEKMAADLLGHARIVAEPLRLTRATAGSHVPGTTWGARSSIRAG